MTAPTPRGTWLLAGIFATSGVLHFARPRAFEAIVPRALPRKRDLVHASGMVELLCAVGLAHPRTRAVAGLTSAVLLVAVLPANVQMALDIHHSRHRSSLVTALAVARLPLQIPLMRVGWQAWRRRTRPGPV